MQLNFHGELRKLYGPRVTMHGRNIADALDGFARQQDNWPKDMRVVVVGYDTPDLLNENPASVDVMPALIGGGGKFGQIIMGAVMIGISFIPGIGTALSASLLISGGLMVAQGVVGLFLKSPSMKTANDPEASKYLSVNRNTTDVGTPITMAWGTIDMAGQWLSLQSDSSNLSFGVFPANPT